MVLEQQQIQIILQSILDGKGFRDLNRQTELFAKNSKLPLSTVQNAAYGLQTQIGKMAEQMGIAPDRFLDSMKKAGIAFKVLKDGQVRYIDSFRGSFLTQKQAMEKLAVKTSRFKMEYLNLMFMSMQLKRIFEGFLKSAVATYQKIADGQTQTSKAIMSMRASWTFFQFALIEALGGLIQWFAKLFVHIADFVAQHPTLMKFVGIFTLFAIAASTFLFWFAQIGLLMGVMPVLLSKLGISGASAFGTKGLMGAASKFFIGLLKWIPVIAFVAYIIYKVFENAQGAILANQKASLAAQEGRWDDYKNYVLARNQIIRHGIIKTFSDIAYGVIYWTLELAKGFLSVLGGMLSFIPGIGDDIAAAFERINQMITEQQMKELENQQRGWEAMNKATTKSMIEMGLSVEDTIEVMKKQGATAAEIEAGLLWAGISESRIDEAFAIVAQLAKNAGTNLKEMSLAEFQSQLPTMESYGIGQPEATSTEYNYETTINIEGVITDPDEIGKIVQEQLNQIEEEKARY